MYEKPAEYKDLIAAINAIPEMGGLGEVVVNVEAVLTLAEAIEQDDEPITVGWVLLAATPTPDSRLNNLSPDQRRLIANARQFIPLNSRFAWEAALRQYANIKQKEHLNYDIAPTNLDEQIIAARKCSPPRHPEHIEDYHRMLSKPLKFRRDSPHRPAANTPYNFVVGGKDGVRHAKIRFRQEHIDLLDHILAHDWIDAVRPREPFTIRLSDLRQIAAWLDEQEIRLGNRPRWVADLAKICFQVVDRTVSPAILTPSDVLDINGFFHMAGIVSSGKTTLAILIAAHLIRQPDDNRRITFVVGDTNTAIQLAHRLNAWFRNDPATDAPVAVPVLGQSTRAVHLERLLISREYQDAHQHGQPHWGERWVSPVCPLQHLMEWTDGDGEPIPLGSEPCQRLQNVPLLDGPKTINNHVCPLFAICPSKQMFRDMPTAQIWITTPGALSQSAVPRHLERRRIKFGDLVYEQSDLVIFDEAETIVDWFDRTYAHDFQLTNGANGLLDRLDDEVTEYLKQNRAAPPAFQKWLFAERAATKAISSILTILDPAQRQVMERLRGWVKSGQFTRNSLSYRLSRRLAGLKEFERRDDLSPAQIHAEEEQTRAVVRYFEELDKIVNPLVQQIVPQTDKPEVLGAYGLAGIMQQMNSAGQDADMSELVRLCKDWVDAFFPDMEAQLGALKVTLEASVHQADRSYLAKGQLDRDVPDLAARLFFTLWVVILDWHLNIVFNEWHRKPAEIRGEQPYQRIPRNLRNILPIPAMGGQFGLYRAPIAKNSGRKYPNHLTQFVYVNIGRSYVLNFHKLRQDLDGQRGPNVLAMSGTSYLPDSSRFHLQTPPDGVLAPDERTRAGLRASHFEFKPFYRKKRPISVSGVSDKLSSLRNLVQAMVKDSFLVRVLEQLRQNAERDPANWGDRARLLMFTNSYTQARDVALTLQKKWPEMANHIFYLSRGKDDQDYEAVLGSNVQRVDIEQFAETEGKILVAPTQSIGRGFNILNNNNPVRLAAFGAVFFLTRYMGQPEDYVAMAQEINRYTVQWAAHENVPPALETADGLYQTALTLRETTRQLSQNIEFRRGYSSLTYKQIDGTPTDIEPELRIVPRADLAATTGGMLIQAIGRLLRGGVPFQAYFIDAAWSPLTAQAGRSIRETAETSLLQAVIDVILTYSDDTNAVGKALYGDLTAALVSTIGLNDN